MTKILFIILLIGFSLAQTKTGFVIFSGDEKWVIQLADSLTIDSGEVISLDEGNYKFKARPQISYSWPTVLVEGTLEVQDADTLIYRLSVEKSSGGDSLFSQLPKITDYSKGVYIPAIQKHSEVKTSLILSALAANWLSFYLKRQADDYYKDYRRASSLAKLNNYYTKTRDFDVYSNIMLGISAAALSSYVYLTLTE
jgi:hypothetical protein